MSASSKAVPIEIVMPRMGLTMESGVIVHWLKQVGDLVQAGEPLLEIETDKSTVEIEAMDSGVLGPITALPGEERLVGEVIAYLYPPDAALDHGGLVPPLPSYQTPVPSPVHASGAQIPELAGKNPSPAPAISQKVKASPAARRLASRLEIELAQIQGSGPGGRIVAWNVQAAATPSVQHSGRVSPVARRLAADLNVDLSTLRGTGIGSMVTRQDVEQAALNRAEEAPVPAPISSASAKPEIEPLTRIQRLVADRMTRSFSTSPHFYLHVDCDARALVRLRQKLIPRMEQSAGVRLTYTDLLVFFCARLLPRHPLVMAQYTDAGYQKFTRPHIGIAVDTDNGLLVPVLRDSDRLDLAAIAQKRFDLAERARLGKLLPHEFEEGVFTISNLGVYRIDAFEAILNPPQAAILAVGRIAERPLVENGQVIPASMLTLSLSVDHRVLDGGLAARFLSDLAELVETPGLALF